MRFLLLAVMALSLSACQLIYRLPTRQGNVIDQRDLGKLQVGMTEDQVKFALGTPLARGPFRDDRWDYFGYYKSPRGEVSTRLVTLFFDDGKLSRMEGAELAANNGATLSEPDLNAIDTDLKADKTQRRNPRSPSQELGRLPTPGGTR